MLYITGDIHGDPISRFSFKSHPVLRELGSEDYMVVLGDCGVPFGYQSPRFNWKEFGYQKKWLSNQKYNFIFIAGNHDDYDFIEHQPRVNKFNNPFVRKMLDNVFYIDTPGVYDIAGQHCLIIPGAESHDVKDGILDPADPDFHNTYKKWLKDYSKMFRVKHWDWWSQESVDSAAVEAALPQWQQDHFDYVFTHDSPDANSMPGELEYEMTKSEEILYSVYNTVAFDVWLHGHFHMNRIYGKDDKVLCLYDQIVCIAEVEL